MRKTSITSVFAAIFLLVLLAGCVNPRTKYGRLSFTIDSAMAARLLEKSYTSRAPTEEEISELQLNVELQGDFSDSKTIRLADGETVTFPEIPVGSRVWSKIAVFKVDGGGVHFPLYQGESEQIVIQQGENTLTVQMENTSTSIDIYVRGGNASDSEETGFGTEEKPFNK